MRLIPADGGFEELIEGGFAADEIAHAKAGAVGGDALGAGGGAAAPEGVLHDGPGGGLGSGAEFQKAALNDVHGPLAVVQGIGGFTCGDVDAFIEEEIEGFEGTLATATLAAAVALEIDEHPAQRAQQPMALRLDGPRMQGKHDAEAEDAEKELLNEIAGLMLVTAALAGVGDEQTLMRVVERFAGEIELAATGGAGGRGDHGWMKSWKKRAPTGLSTRKRTSVSVPLKVWLMIW